MGLTASKPAEADDEGEQGVPVDVDPPTTVCFDRKQATGCMPRQTSTPLGQQNGLARYSLK